MEIFLSTNPVSSCPTCGTPSCPGCGAEKINPQSPSRNLVTLGSGKFSNDSSESVPKDSVEISDLGKSLFKPLIGEGKASPSKTDPKPEGENSGVKTANGPELTDDEKAEIRELAQRDREVRAHEQAHAAAGGQYVKGGPTYDFQKGPDGKNYAVGGEVSIDSSPVAGDPAATIRKMQVVKRAATAPARPSGQDRSVASQAAAQEAQARTELMKEQQENRESAAGDTSSAEDAQQGGPTTPYDTQPTPENGKLLNIAG